MKNSVFTVSIDHQRKVVFYRHHGVIKMDDIGLAWEEFLKMEEFVCGKYNLLSDYSQGVYDFNIKDIDLIVGFLQNLQGVICNKKQAMIIDNPYSTAAAMLFVDSVFEKTGFIVKVFSTEEAALFWLNA